MNKYAKIKLVKDFYLNTEENILVRNMEDLDCEFISVRNNFSLRTFYHKDPGFKKAPHYPTIDIRGLFKVAPDLLRQGLWLIPADIIDPRDCLFRGAAIKTDDKIIAEIKVGSGTVRTVTRDLDIDYRIECGNDCFDFMITKVNKRIQIQKFRYDFYYHVYLCLFHFINADVNNCCFEFSYYNKPIGWVPEQFICWEVDFFGEDSPVNRYNYLWSRYERNN